MMGQVACLRQCVSLQPSKRHGECVSLGAATLRPAARQQRAQHEERVCAVCKCGGAWLRSVYCTVLYGRQR